MLDPAQPHSIPSSPISVESACSHQDLFGAADSVPIFQAVADAAADTVPWDPTVGCEAHAAEDALGGCAASSEDPSVELLDRTGSSAEDESYTQYSKLRSTQNLEELQEHVIGSSTWTSVVVDSLNQQQRSNLMLRREIRYGDDCSGARAPYEALCQLVTRLGHAGIEVPIEDMFASECPGRNGDGPRAFIEAQCPPAIIFDTVHRGIAACGKNLRTGERVVIPSELTVYTAGWVCRDISTMNRHRRPLLPGNHKEVVAGKAGASSQTLDSSLKYVRIFRPDIALLENLVNKKNILIATEALKAMGGYSTCVLLTDSRSFAVPMSRRRMYLLAVRTHLLTASLGELVSQLKDIAKKIPPVSDTSLPKLLDEEGTGVSIQRMSLKARFRLAMDTGERKRRKWSGHHDQIRSGCGLPTRTEIVKSVKAHSPVAVSLPLRCQELLGLHWEVAVRGGIQPREHHFVWDLTNSAKFNCTKDPRLSGVVPCALRGHCLWDTALGRPLSGTELMRVHGFCLEPAVAQLPNSIISQLAGDTISVPPVGCILALALANTRPPLRAVASWDKLPEHHVPACWVGPSAWRGFDRSRDNLMALAGARTSRTKRLERASAKQRLGKNVVISLESASAKQHLGKNVVISLE